MILHNNKTFHFKNLLRSILVIAATTLICGGLVAQAAIDDPGKGRLSGESIPAEFYDTSSVDSYKAGEDSFTTYSPYTNLTYTHQGKYKNRRIYNGIDVSEWQGVIDWKKVKADGIDYAFIRVGGRGYGSGALFMDKYFEENMKNASAAGIKIGVYIFSQAITTTEAVEEANYILSHIKGYKISMPLIMDYEYASGSSDGGRLQNANLTPTEATKVCMAFCNKIKSAGYIPMVYANKYMFENQLLPTYLTNQGYKIWLANYTTETTYAGKMDFWQYSSTGSVDGISGNVDMNFYYAPRIHAKNLTCKAIEPLKYNGKYQTPNIDIYYMTTKLTRNVDYKLTYANNGYPGMATITVTGIGNFYGTTTANFIILPRTVTGVTATAKGLSAVAFKWGASVNATGYQIYRSTSPDGTFTPIKMVSSKITSYTDKGLNSGQCYYYKVRSFIIVNSKKYWGEYSDMLAINTKLDHTRTALAKKDAPLCASAGQGAKIITRLSYLTTMDVFYLTQDTIGRSWYYVKVTTKGKTYRGYVPVQSVFTCKLGQVAYTDYGFVTKNPGSRVRFCYLPKNQKVYIINNRTINGTPWYQIYFMKNNKGYTGWISSKECAIK